MIMDRLGLLTQHLHRRSTRLIAAAEGSIAIIAALWAAALTALLIYRFSQVSGQPSWGMLGIHLLLVLSPAVGITLAARAFPHRPLETGRRRLSP